MRTKFLAGCVKLRESAEAGDRESELRVRDSGGGIEQKGAEAAKGCGVSGCRVTPGNWQMATDNCLIP
jgi:hypothetical protein